MTLPDQKSLLQAVQARDGSYDDRFVYGVVTTGVFCKPSCKSRPARPENLRFFDSGADALKGGFRPCQRCRPLGRGAELDDVVDIARHIEKHAGDNVTLAALAKLSGLSAGRLQRSFKAAFGISPKAFQDAVRLRRLKSSLKDGDGIAGAIYEAGYGSSSRVYGKAAKSIGMTPATYRAGGEGELISYACRKTSLGPLLMAATEKGVCFVQFGESGRALVEQLRSEFPNATLTAASDAAAEQLDSWATAIDAYIDGAAPRPDLPLDLRGTALQVAVWRFLLTVPDGEVMSYGEVARAVGKPRAARAVASACGANRIGLLVPCHRVLRADGNLGGYRWGLERKRALLASERARQSTSAG